MSGLDSLALVLQNFNSFDVKAIFQIMFSLILAVYRGAVQLMALGSWCPTGIFWKVENIVSVLFFVWNLQTVFPLKPMFSRHPFFCTFCSYSWGFILRLHVLALPASLTFSWPAKRTLNLNMSALDFLALVLQIFNSFNMKASFRVLFSLILTAYKGAIQLMDLGSWCPTGVFLKGWEYCFCPFFLSEIFKLFSR